MDDDTFESDSTITSQEDLEERLTALLDAAEESDIDPRGSYECVTARNSLYDVQVSPVDADPTPEERGNGN
ncbi:hypothetical protein ACFPYI_04325 [Halomarina salina]|uniref:Halobacterial output domain-containing protein n=1 Tax=Halomarina salina TaxID=1872699 RepID=A0ABD5RJ97_9EURY|nr:hypothetical protein [Halomarina salina]